MWASLGRLIASIGMFAMSMLLMVAPPGSPPALPSPAEVDSAVLRFLDANLKK